MPCSVQLSHSNHSFRASPSYRKSSKKSNHHECAPTNHSFPFPCSVTRRSTIRNFGLSNDPVLKPLPRAPGKRGYGSVTAPSVELCPRGSSSAMTPDVKFDLLIKFTCEFLFSSRPLRLWLSHSVNYASRTGWSTNKWLLAHCWEVIVDRRRQLAQLLDI